MVIGARRSLHDLCAKVTSPVALEENLALPMVLTQEHPEHFGFVDDLTEEM